MNYYEDAKMRAEAMFKRELSDRELAEALSEQFCKNEEEIESLREEVVHLRREIRDVSMKEHVLSERVLDKLDEILSIPHETMEITIMDDCDTYRVRYISRGAVCDIEKDDDSYPMP